MRRLRGVPVSQVITLVWGMGMKSSMRLGAIICPNRSAALQQPSAQGGGGHGYTAAAAAAAAADTWGWGGGWGGCRTAWPSSGSGPAGGTPAGERGSTHELSRSCQAPPSGGRTW